MSWTAVFVHIGKRGPRWCSLAVPWCLLTLCLVILGHWTRRGWPSQRLLLEYEQVCLIGCFLTVLFRATTVRKLLTLILWPTWSTQMLTPELIVGFSARSVLISVDLIATSMVLGCLATHPPLLLALRQPFVHVLEAEYVDAALLLQLARSPLPLALDQRLPLFVLDAAVGAAIFCASPLIVYVAMLFFRMHWYKFVAWRARKKSEALQKDLTKAVGRLLLHDHGSPFDVLRTTQDSILQKALEQAVRQKVMKQLEGEIQTAARHLLDAFRRSPAPPQQDKILLRFSVTPTVKAKWELRRLPE